ncbi:MAG: DUF3016 domain-containing protein [Methylobacterium sp.]|uniref:DUF3016 domain-containing protein n=1 Tax=Methylobacterium sp. TaxID=409 RepID=UPI0025F7F2AF|nr:DUF3016 domain-containing protein [Methylobacterium sp.]MBX9934856.1 DUF3016 domain-containing protein [Methylobacterium sp.]
MNGVSSSIRASIVGAVLLTATAATAQVQVRYVAPEHFTDAENRRGSGLTLRATLSEMTRILEQLGQAHLRPGESLELTVLDIDLAGFERSAASSLQGLRIVNDVTPPRIRLAYALRRRGRIVSQGEESISDINFLLNFNSRLSTGGLYYERAVLKEWFAKRFPT